MMKMFLNKSDELKEAIGGENLELLNGSGRQENGAGAIYPVEDKMPSTLVLY